MSKALEYTKDIVVASLSYQNSDKHICHKGTGEDVADYFQAIYNKIKEIEEQPVSLSN